MSKMIECKSCGAEVSKSAEACPKCGAVLKKKKRPTGCGTKLLFIILICIGIGVWMSKSFKESQEKQQVADEAASISTITFAELDKYFCASSDATKIQKNEKWKQYKGKKVKWTGQVASVSGTSMGIKMKPLTMTSDVTVGLKDSEGQKAFKLKKGDSVTFIGVLRDWGVLMGYYLRNGEIIQK